MVVDWDDGIDFGPEVLASQDVVAGASERVGEASFDGAKSANLGPELSQLCLDQVLPFRAAGGEQIGDLFEAEPGIPAEDDYR